LTNENNEANKKQVQASDAEAVCNIAVRLLFCTVEGSVKGQEKWKKFRPMKKWIEIMISPLISPHSLQQPRCVNRRALIARDSDIDGALHNAPQHCSTVSQQC